MSNRRELSRRSFLQVVGGVGASFALGSFSAVACGTLDKLTTVTKAGVVFAPNALVKIDPDGAVTVTIQCPDAGQGPRTSLAMLVAEELDVDWRHIKVTQASEQSHGMGGSATIRNFYTQLRKIGASARAMVVEAAAQTWKVDASTLKTSKGRVYSADGKKSIGYGELTAIAASLPLPTGEVALKSAEEFQIIGKPTTRVDNPDVATGRAIYGLDIKVPGMVYAVIARAPAFGASLKSFDATAAKAVDGVLDVIQVPRGVAVIGKNTWAALSGRKALKLDWDLGPNASLTSDQLAEQMKAAVVAHKDMPAGSKVVEATMEFPFLAHATMEPINAVADVKDDHCTVWTGTQQPGGALQTAARAAGLQPEQVTLNITLLGGGFGRRLSAEYVEDAVLVSKAIKKPVKLMWTREDDMQHDNYRPACHASFKGAVDASGAPVGWSHQTITPGGRGRRGGGAPEFGGANISYNIPNAGMLQGSVPSPISTGAWRSVENTLHNVANECFMDELAHAAGKDPFEFRKGLIQNDRLRHVLEVAAEKAGWTQQLPAGHGRGIACFAGYGSYAAHVVELSVQGNTIKLHRAICVVDCGTAVNPKGVEAQLQGACTDGLSTALRAAITIDKGGVVQRSWPDFQWMTLDAMPNIEVTIIPSAEAPGGMGEVGYPSVAPAVANAIAAATGKRVRKFPIKIEELA